jgi:hypothetical protein
VAVEGERNPDRFAVPAGELHGVRGPADVRAQRRDLAVVLTRPTTAGVRGEQQSVLLHQPIDALGVDGGQTGGSTLAFEECCDAPVSVGGPGVDEAADLGSEFEVAVAGLRAA